MFGIFILRLVQLAGLIAIAFGLKQLGALVSQLQSIWQGQAWTVAQLCTALAMVSGPVLIGLAVIAALEFPIRIASRRRRATPVPADQPWLANPNWAAKHIRLSNRPLLIGSILCWILYIFVGIPFVLATGNKALFWMAVAFGVFGLLLMRMFWLNRRWNTAELRISTMPGVIGGPFSGAVILQETFPADTVFDVNLKCELTRVQKASRKSKTTHTDLWTSTIYLQKPLTGGPPNTTALPISFAIPYDAWPTKTENNESIRWVLTVQKKEEVSTGGASFEIPVYRTAESRPDYEFDQELMQQHLAVFDPADILKRYGLRESWPSSDCLRLYFREFDLGIFVTLIVMSLILIAIMVPMWFWIKDANTKLFAMVFPGIFLAMFLYGIVYMLLWRCRIDRITQSSANPDVLAELQTESEPTGVIEAESGIWGFRKSIRVPADRTSSLRCRIDHRANNKESWSIWLSGANKQSLKILGTFNGATEAHEAAKFLAGKLGISVAKIKAEDGYLNN